LGEGFVETNFVTDPPTLSPSLEPTVSPSEDPTLAPSREPSATPTALPTAHPTMPPSREPSSSPATISGDEERGGAKLLRGASFAPNVPPSPDDDASATRWEGPSRAETEPGSSDGDSPNEADSDDIEPGSNWMTVQAAEDSTLSAQSPDDALGFGPSLVVDGHSFRKRDAVLKFDISFVETTSVRDAALRLYVQEGGSGYCGSFLATRTASWTEGTVTYTNAPSGHDGIEVGQAWGAEAGEWLEMDVADAIDWAWNEGAPENGGSKKYLSVRITSNVANECVFSSSNGPIIHSPHLRIVLGQAEQSLSQASDVSAVEEPEPSRRDQGETLLLLAADDATIVEEEPDLNLGDLASLVVDKGSTILIRFDIAEMRRTVPTKAVLALYIGERCESAGMFGTASGFDDGRWREGDVSWSTAPAYERGGHGGGTMIGTFGRVQTDQWFGFDVAKALSQDVVREQASITFRISSDNGGRCEYASIQGGKAAKLMLEF